MAVSARRGVALAAALALGACGGSGGSGGGGAPSAAAPAFLNEADVDRVIARAAAEAQARGLAATISVVDRVGNVLATFEMAGAPATVAVSSGLGVAGGLDGIAAGTVPAALAALSKAITGAYLSSQGNAFSTRTAGQIVQEHFNPQESQQPSGPLYGVQFSQLACSDVMRRPSQGDAGPKASPLGLSADPGGLPLYKDGILVGGVGVEANGVYGLDRDITDLDDDAEEAMAVAGAFGLEAPADIRGDRITADGRTFRYLDSAATRSDPARAPALASVPGQRIAVAGFAPSAPRAGTPYGTPASGIRPGSGGAWVLDDGQGNNRFPPRAGLDGRLAAPEVEALLGEALAVARRARGQIRRPLGSTAEVSIAVVDTTGAILGFVRTPDGPVFGIDVAVQKARTAMFFSHPDAARALSEFPAAQHVPGEALVAPGRYRDAAAGFLGDPLAFSGAVAWSARAIGNLHRPTYPDGIEGTPHGPLSTPMAQWSPFNVGLQLDLAYNQLLNGAFAQAPEGVPCVGQRFPANAAEPTNDLARRLANGMQIFPGGVPIYRGEVLVGGIGVSGDGVDQDDMVAYLGLRNAGLRLGTGIANAPRALRADQFVPHGARIRYVQCPQSPFVDSNEQNVCD